MNKPDKLHVHTFVNTWIADFNYNVLQEKTMLNV